MKKVDYIIVGDGYAAMFFAHQLIINNKSFVLYSSGDRAASHKSAGIINPVVLKRFTTFWLAMEQINALKSTLNEIAQYTGKNHLVNHPVHRIFHSEEEKNSWLKKAQKENLQPFLNTTFCEIDGFKNSYGVGKVNHSARLDVDSFFNDFFNFLGENDYLVKEKFDYNSLSIDNSTYKDIDYSSIVFCEGTGVLENPFFSDLPIQPNKGHLLNLNLAKHSDIQITLKKKHFLFQKKDGSYYYGGTYDRFNLDSSIDEKARQQLIQGLEEFYPYDYSINKIEFGFRPTVKDRRPIIGSHSTKKNLFVFNGLGARGILNGCYFSKVLFDHIENREPLPEEVDIQRF